jgi:Ca-activated chloride channel homolog
VQPALGRRSPPAPVAAGLVALALALTGIAALPNGPAPGWLEAWLRPDGPPPVPEGSPCPAPLSVVADPDIADVIAGLVGPEHGECAQVEVVARDAADVLAELTRGGPGARRPDVWIPASSLWLRLARSRGVAPSFGAARTSLARSPVVMAVPTPLYDRIKGPNVWPVWIMVYDYVTAGRIPTMHMPDPGTTDEGALTMVALWEAMVFHSDRSSDGAALRTVNLRDHLTSTNADIDELLADLAGMTDGADAITQVGMFPATEQRVLAFNARDPAVPVTPMGLYDAIAEADYPMAVSAAVDGRQADVIDELRARLRSPDALQRLVDAGFRPPRGVGNPPAELQDTQRWPDYPEPVGLPDARGWNTLMHLWSLD